jgi:hypothetical protein
MKTDAPATAFIVLSVISIMALSIIPLVGLFVYTAVPEVTQPVADPTGDEK